VSWAIQLFFVWDAHGPASRSWPNDNHHSAPRLRLDVSRCFWRPCGTIRVGLKVVIGGLSDRPSGYRRCFGFRPRPGSPVPKTPGLSLQLHRSRSTRRRRDQLDLLHPDGPREVRVSNHLLPLPFIYVRNHHLVHSFSGWLLGRVAPVVDLFVFQPVREMPTSQVIQRVLFICRTHCYEYHLTQEKLTLHRGLLLVIRLREEHVIMEGNIRFKQFPCFLVWFPRFAKNWTRFRVRLKLRKHLLKL